MTTTRRSKIDPEHERIRCVFNRLVESVTYSVKDGADLTFQLTGFVSDDEPRAFARKAVAATFSSTSRDAEWLARAGQHFGQPDICGPIDILARIEEEEIEADSVGMKFSPIQIAIGVAHEVWRDLRELVHSSVATGHRANAEFQFSPLADIPYGLNNLDTSEEKTYPIRSFDLYGTVDLIQQPQK